MKYVFGFLLAGLSLYILSPLFHSGLYISHDGINHVARLAGYIRAFSEGQFPPRWVGGTLNHGFGSPLFLFFYPLPGYLGSLLHLGGLSLENCFKVLMGLCFFGMGFSWYFWIRELFGNKRLAILSAVIYTLVPYHLLDVYVRGDIGEVLSFVFLPLVFWALHRRSIRAFLIGASAYCFTLLSHNAMSLIFTPVIVAYGLLLIKQKKDALYVGGILGLGLGLAAFFWIPALLESRYINTSLYIGTIYTQHFLPFSKIITSPWGFGPNIAAPDGLSAQLGIIYSIVVGLLWIFKFKNCIKNRFIIFWTIILLVSLFLATPLSNGVWSHIAIMRNFQFPWRFVGLASFCVSILSAYFLKFLSKPLRYFITIILVISILPFVTVAGYIHHDDLYYAHFSGSTYFHGEATTLWLAGDPTSFAKSPFSVVTGNGSVHMTKSSSQMRLFSVDAKEQMRIVINTIYFPGWKVFVDNVKTPIEFQDMRYRGLITFYVPSGKHMVKAEFTDTPVRLVANIISIFSLLLVVGIGLMYKRKQ